MGRQTDDGLTMNQLAERNAEYVMTIADLEGKCAAMTAKLSMINDLMEAAEQVNKLAQEAAEKLVQECNALAAENAGLKSALNDILQPDAAVLERNHRVRALDAMETPATDAFLDDVWAQALEQFAVQQESISEKYPAGSYGQESAYDAAQCARKFAEQLRQEAAQ